MTTQLNLRVGIRAAKRHPWRASIVAASIVAAVAIGFGVVMPRGPMTTVDSVAGFVSLAIVGVIVGILTSTRWSALAAPLLFAGVFELTRLGQTGPTVDAVRLGDIYGIFAFVAGRGFDAVVLLLPLALGALWGAAIARRAVGEVSARWLKLRRSGLALSGAVAALLLVALVRPASTDPIVDANGDRVEGSIAELVTVPIGGHDQSLMLRGVDADAPVLLFLEGGPGGTATGSMRFAGQELEQSFVVATWDQRGTGRSADEFEPSSTLTLDQMVSDTIEVSEYLRDRFDEQAIYVVGSSWGTTLGVLAVQQRPDLYRAYIGTGQMVDQFETDQLMYADSLAYAERTGNEAFAKRLRDIGAPPYDDTLAYTQALASNPEWVDYPRGEDYDLMAEYPQSLFVKEFTLTEQFRAASGMFETFAVLYPQLADVDFRRTVPELEVPVYLIEGSYEAPGRSALAFEWFDMLDAPSKEVVVFENSGHTPQRDEPGRFAEYLASVVLAQTGSSR